MKKVVVESCHCSLPSGIAHVVPMLIDVLGQRWYAMEVDWTKVVVD
jgi:hypothetical protein